MALQSIPGASSFGPTSSYGTTLNSTSTNVKAGNETGSVNDASEGRDNKIDPISDRQVKVAINQANEKLKFTRTRCELTYHENVKRVAIKVIDSETDEVIREIPPEETIELVQKLWELAGIIIDEKR